jgi:hypothetical protein
VGHVRTFFGPKAGRLFHLYENGIPFKEEFHFSKSGDLA